MIHSINSYVPRSGLEGLGVFLVPDIAVSLMNIESSSAQNTASLTMGLLFIFLGRDIDGEYEALRYDKEDKMIVK